MDKRKKNILTILYLSSKLVLKTVASILFIVYASDFLVDQGNLFFHGFLTPLGDLLDDLVTEHPDGFPFHWNLFFTPANLLSFIAYHFLFFIYESLFSLHYGFCWGLSWGVYLYLWGVGSLYPWIFFGVGHGKVRDWLIKLPKNLFTTRTDVISPDFRISDLEQVRILFKSKEVWVMRDRYEKFLRIIVLHQDILGTYPRLANFVKGFYFKYGYLEWIVFSVYNNPFYLFDLGRHWFFIYSRGHWIELIQWFLFTFMTVCLDIYYFIVVNALFSIEKELGSQCKKFAKKGEAEHTRTREFLLLLGIFCQRLASVMTSLALFFVAYKFWLPFFFIFKLLSLYFVFIVEGPLREKIRLGLRACGMLFRLSFFYIYFYYGWYLFKSIVKHAPKTVVDYKNIYNKENISRFDVFFINRLFNIILILIGVLENIVSDFIYHFCENLQILKNGDYVGNIHRVFLGFNSNENKGDIINFSRLFK